ncbi:CoF synthetase [Rhodospirillum rubrum]|uniref:CoF synthetase n=1 Tax=Rhodospirillum rubrum TaxID=1085 RepID=UPI001903CBDA|nr:CoF synthetase [Rhodospirillum rubrum]MBK1666085.1 CoF synthetase [Rhodospirillum rubrum]MBK1678351.1 CoF synthetase [Rhodospirillum rubrum]
MTCLAPSFSTELDHRLAAGAPLPAADLAELFRLAESPTPEADTLRHGLQKHLLARTLEHARTNTAFYRRDPAYHHWRPQGTGGAPCLDGLPAIDRAQVVAHHGEILATDVTLRSICHTSGTTGTPLDVYKSFEECRFIADYFNAMFEPLRRLLPSLPLSLSFPNNYHGVPLPMPGLGMGFVGGVTDDTLILDARRLIDTPYALPGHDSRIRFLSGLGHHVLLFTSWLQECGVDPATYGFGAVTVTGGYLAPHWMGFLRESWKCPINNRFTLTETVGGASRLYDRDRFVVDPFLIMEALAIDDDTAIASGVGRLAITNLHPFVQMQPLIRYLTGDLVRWITPPLGRPRFDFLGKQKNCLRDPFATPPSWLVFSAVLNDILSDIPDINVYDWFSNVRVVHDRSVGSLPLIAVSSQTDEDGGLAIVLDIELRYAPATRRARLAEIERTIVERLRATPDTTLAQRLDEGRVRLRIDYKAPGQLRSPIVIKI